jgi:hypothetical protein
MSFKRRVSFLGLIFSVSLVLFLEVGLLASAASNGDYALGFDGSTDNVRLDYTITMMGTPTWVTTKTVSMWVRPLGTYSCTAVAPSPPRCDAIFGDAPRWWGISRGINVTPPVGGDMIWVWSVDYQNGTTDYIGFPYTVGEWVHVALVHGNGRLRAYKNGVLMGDVANGPTFQPPGQPILHFGGLVESSTPYMFEGQIDEVQIWNVARTGEEIRRDMYRTLTGSEPGLQAYYRMTDGTGLTVTDDSVNSFNGTLRDGWPGCSPCPPPNGTYPLWLASGAFVGPRNALAFDGADDYVAIGANAATVIGGGWAATKSVEVWVKPDTAAPAAASASQGDWIFGGANWGISQATIDGSDRLWVWNNDGSEDRIGLEYTPGEWVHIVLNHGGGMLTAYRNGMVAGSRASGSTITDGNLTAGGLSGGQPFDGQLDELRVWDDARSQVELQSNLFQTVEGGESGLMAYYRFDQQNQAGQMEVVDSANYGRHATMMNMDPATAWLLSTAFNTWIGSESQAWHNGQNWSRYAATNANVAVTDYVGSYAATITSSTTITNGVVALAASLEVLDTLTVNGNLVNMGTVEAADLTVTAGSALEMHSGGVLTVTGLLQNNGTLQQTQAVDGSGIARFFDTGGYGGLTMDSGGQNLGNTAVIIRGNQQCTTVPDETVLRCYDITPELLPATGISMTFSFADSELPSGMLCDDTQVFHRSGGIWTEITPTIRNCSQPLNFITVENVVTFSPFVIGQIPDTPTAVTLNSFTIAPDNHLAALAVVMLPIIFAAGSLWWLIRRREKGIV